MSEQQQNLEQELLSAGAGAAEAQDLARLARRLPAMRQLPLVQAPPTLQMGRKMSKRRLFARWSSRVALFAGSMAAAVVAAAVVVVAAQMAVPGDGLYSIKRASEAVAVRFNPGFHDEMMMRRTDEVNQLVARGSSPSLISATLTSYDQTVTRDPASSYATRDYCARMLETAAAHAGQPTRAQILHSQSLLKLQSS